MYDSLGKALCIKGRSLESEPDRGTVKILFIESEHRNQFKPYWPETEAEDGIFLTHDYVAVNSFSSDEIFCINAYRQSDNDNWKESTGYLKKFVSRGAEVSKLNKQEMLPVIHCPLPDKKTGIIAAGIHLPENKYFFIRDAETVYGPFLAEKIADQGNQLIPLSTPSLSLDKDHIVAIDAQELERYTIEHPLTGEYFFPSLTSINKQLNDFKKIDFISDKELVRYYAKHGFGKNFKKLSKSEAKRFFDAIHSYNQQTNSYKSPERLERFKGILGDYLSHDDVGQDVLNEWLKSNHGELFFEQFIRNNKSKIVSGRLAKLDEEIENEHAQLAARTKKHKIECETEIERLTNELEKIKAEYKHEKQQVEEDLAAFRQQSEEFKKEEIHKQNAELMAEIESLEQRRKTITQENKALSEELELLRTGRSLQTVNELLEIRKDELQRIIEEKNALLNDPSALRKFITQHKTLKQLLSLQSSENTEQTVEFAKVVSCDQPSLRPEDYIEAIKSYLDEQDGRSFTRDEVANMMICIAQNYLTCIAGSPGTGKTSSVVRLAEAMGLYRAHENKICHFLNISVGQGWAGVRDLLGYFNGIKGEFQPAPTQLYELLQDLQQEQEKKYLRLVLLDEGNLSPLEHYWSDFLQMADAEHRHKKLIVGGKGSQIALQPGNYLRWITTINSDETTERLSPRLLDRIPVIKMSPELDVDSILHYTTADNHPVPGGVEWKTLEGWFTPREEQDFSVTDRQIIQFILEQNKDVQLLHLSQRKLKKMRSYLAVANQHMGENQALDWCIAMYALPTIQGYGQAAERALKGLLEAFDKHGLRRSFKIVDSILKEGRLSQSYSFF